MAMAVCCCMRSSQMLPRAALLSLRMMRRRQRRCAGCLHQMQRSSVPVRCSSRRQCAGRRPALWQGVWTFRRCRLSLCLCAAKDPAQDKTTRPPHRHLPPCFTPRSRRCPGSTWMPGRNHFLSRSPPWQQQMRTAFRCRHRHARLPSSRSGSAHAAPLTRLGPRAAVCSMRLSTSCTRLRRTRWALQLRSLRIGQVRLCPAMRDQQFQDVSVPKAIDAAGHREEILSAHPVCM